MKHHDFITWKNPKERSEFENDLRIFRKHRGERSGKEKIGFPENLCIAFFGNIVYKRIGRRNESSV